MVRALLWLGPVPCRLGRRPPADASQVLLNLGCNLAPVLPDDANGGPMVLCRAIRR